MLDVAEGKMRYAALSSGGLSGIGSPRMGDRLFAALRNALKTATGNTRFMLNEFMLDDDIERSKNTPGFDKDRWPDMADATWNSTVDSCYAR